MTRERVRDLLRWLDEAVAVEEHYEAISMRQLRERDDRGTGKYINKIGHAQHTGGVHTGGGGSYCCRYRCELAVRWVPLPVHWMFTGVPLHSIVDDGVAVRTRIAPVQPERKQRVVDGRLAPTCHVLDGRGGLSTFRAVVWQFASMRVAVHRAGGAQQRGTTCIKGG